MKKKIKENDLGASESFFNASVNVMSTVSASIMSCCSGSGTLWNE